MTRRSYSCLMRLNSQPWVASVIAIIVPVYSAIAQGPQSEEPPRIAEEVVVVGRRTAEEVKQEHVRDTIPSATIKAYGSDSIGQLLNRLAVRFKDGYSIVVNGRRLASLDAINALPPEALQMIEILDTSASTKYGFATGTEVVNLRLRPRFQSMSIDTQDIRTTEGGGGRNNATVRLSRLAGNRRFNVAITHNRQSGLLERDRAVTGPPLLSSVPHSLVPRQTLTMLTGGFAEPLGSYNLDLSTEAGSVRSDSLTGRATAANLMQPGSQRNSTKFLKAGATISGTSTGISWSVFANGEISHNSIANTIGLNPDNNSGSRIGLPYYSNTASRSISITANASGALLSVPAGAVTFDTTSTFQASALSSALQTIYRGATTNFYRTLSNQFGLNLPISQRGVGQLGKLGTVNVRTGINTLSLSGEGNAVASSLSLEWLPLPKLSLLISKNSIPSLPSATQRFFPEVYMPGALVYDSLTGRVVPVTVISGGSDNLKRSKTSNAVITASYHIQGRFASISTFASYAITKIDSPLVSIGIPSPLAQRFLPSLFVRDSVGTLTSFDSRPFNARDETDRQITAGLHLNGLVPPAGASGGASDNTALIDALSLYWDLNLNYNYYVNHQLSLGAKSKALDLLATPLSLGGAGVLRNRIDIQWTLARENYGLNGSLNWSSGMRLRSLDDEASSIIRYSAVTRVSVEGFITLDRSTDEAKPRSLKLVVSIDNLLNQRINVSGIPGPKHINEGLLLDPYGRTIKVAIRRMF